MKIARDPNTDTGTKVSIYSLLMRYTSPIPKAVDDADPDHSIKDEPTDEEVIAMAQYILGRQDQKAPARLEGSAQETDAKSEGKAGDESHEH